MRPPRRRHLKNAAAEAQQFRQRAAIAFIGVVLALAGLALWYFRLQVWQHGEYATRSEANRIKPLPVVPGRGLILDRKGRVLADNVPAYRLDVVPDEAGDTTRLLASLSRIVELSPEDIRHFEQKRKATRGFRAITLKLRVDEEEAARFAVDRWRFPGVELVPYLNRRYPHGPLFAHVIGYVGRIDEADLAKMGEIDSALTHTGKTGLERSYEELLRGKVGYEKIETNVEGRALRTLGKVPAIAGSDLRLSIDLDLQQAMVTAFGELEGSAVALDPRTGEVLAMVSIPSYDPNLFVNGISHADFNALNANPSRPQFNRVVLGGVAPGSTLKPLIGLAGLDSGLRRPHDKVLSTGMFHLPGVRRGWGDSHRGGHGWTDLRKSISESVNTYYYRLAMDMGIARFDEYMRRYGFGEPSGIDLAGEIAGILPSPESKAKGRGERWYPGDTVNAAIGQGDWKVTMLQMARANAAIADGNLRRPHLVAEVRTGFDARWRKLPQPPARPISPNPGNLQAVREGMVATTQPGGTAAGVFRDVPYLMAGKTGTAQVVSRRGGGAVNPKSLPMHLRHRALFVGFAPAEAPTIAIAVAVEGGGYGASTAGPIARKIVDAWLLGVMPEAEPPAIPATPAAPATQPSVDFGNVVAGTADASPPPARGRAQEQPAR